MPPFCSMTASGLGSNSSGGGGGGMKAVGGGVAAPANNGGGVQPSKSFLELKPKLSSTPGKGPELVERILVSEAGGVGGECMACKGGDLQGG